MKWLMVQSAIDEIERMRASQVTLSDKVAARNRTVDMKRGSVAVVKIDGPLLNERDPILDYFGLEYTLYSEICADMSEAVDRKAKRIDLLFGKAPGGPIDGMYSTMQYIRECPVKTRAVVKTLMASAAYMLGSQTDQIVATDALSLVGSVGIAAKVPLPDREVEVANTDSPKKRPDVTTDEGVAIVREELDDIFTILAEEIAAGRGTTVDAVNRDYGQGAVMTARKALANRMIDDILGKDINTPIAANAMVQQSRSRSMNLDDLKQDQPGLYREAFEAGVKAERTRVSAHLTLAGASQDYEAAHEAIREGTDLNDEVRAHHMAADIRLQNIKRRDADAPPAVEPKGEVLDVTNMEARDKAAFESSHPGWEVS